MKLKWGIVGLGRIAHQFIQDLQLLDEHEVVAVAARDMNRAKVFGQQYGVKDTYSNYQSVWDHDEVDIVYIATPHHNHSALSIAAMNAGKHVLCEKPLAVNKSEVEAMIRCAKEQQVFMMEAFWSRFNPTISEVLQQIKAGAIGEVNYINADFTFRVELQPDDRMLSMDTAGGSLLEMGVYPVFLAYIILGMPKEILATACLHENGADLQTGIILKYEQGMANLMSGYLSQSDMRARICGTEGRILMDPIWHETQGYSLIREGESKAKQLPTLGKGFTYEIQECLKCIEAGLIENPDWRHQDNMNMFTMLDEVRRQSGLIYPSEQN